MREVFLSAALISCLFLASCSEPHEALGHAYVAPAKLHVRHDLSQKSSTVADLKHATEVTIVDVQRRMVKIRTHEGVEGWVDSLDLLSADQMSVINKARQQAAALPSQGQATAFEILNIHIDPSRNSPAFAQIPEGGAVTVLGHRVTPKVSAPTKAAGLVMPRTQSPRKQRKEQKERTTSFRLPPKPPPPKPPENWLELSTERIDGEAGPQTPAPPAKPKVVPIKPAAVKPVVMEDWTLIRTKAGDTGWVLTRNLLMSIPDEVAQYAEGKHITAFFDMGAVNDEVKGQKHNWLWTTASGALPYDFDAWRVFLWNARHHRYETSYRQRDLEGYFPVHVDAPDGSSPMRTFEIVTKDDDGKLRRRTYSFDGVRVHLTGTEDYQPGTAAGEGSADGIDPLQLQTKTAHPNWFRRQWATVKHRVFGN